MSARNGASPHSVSRITSYGATHHYAALSWPLQASLTRTMLTLSLATLILQLTTLQYSVSYSSPVDRWLLHRGCFRSRIHLHDPQHPRHNTLGHMVVWLQTSLQLSLSLALLALVHVLITNVALYCHHQYIASFLMMVDLW